MASKKLQNENNYRLNNRFSCPGTIISAIESIFSILRFDSAESGTLKNASFSSQNIL
jgi:hypothetical protein